MQHFLQFGFSKRDAIDRRFTRISADDKFIKEEDEAKLRNTFSTHDEDE